MNSDQRDAVKALAANRPLDVNGQPVEMGPWYWAMNRLGQVVGAGKFAATIGWGNISFFINGTGYTPESFNFVKAENPDLLFHGKPHDLCANPNCKICWAKT